MLSYIPELNAMVDLISWNYGSSDFISNIKSRVCNEYYKHIDLGRGFDNHHITLI